MQSIGVYKPASNLWNQAVGATESSSTLLTPFKIFTNFPDVLYVDIKDKSTASSPQAQEKIPDFFLSSGPAVCFDSTAEFSSQRLVRGLSAVRAHVDLEGFLVRRLFNVNHP